MRSDAATGSVGGEFRQSCQAEGGAIAGAYSDGEDAVAENSFGKGRVRLIGTMSGYSSRVVADEQTRRFFASHLAFADVEPYVRTPSTPASWSGPGRIRAACSRRLSIPPRATRCCGRSSTLRHLPGSMANRKYVNYGNRCV